MTGPADGVARAGGFPRHPVGSSSGDALDGDDAELVDDEGGARMLGGTSARPLAGDDAPVEQQFAAPDAPWLLTVRWRRPGSCRAATHLLQIAFARPMSTRSSEKNNGVNVPLPSAQRGPALRTTGWADVDVGLGEFGNRVHRGSLRFASFLVSCFVV